VAPHHDPDHWQLKQHIIVRVSSTKELRVASLSRSVAIVEPAPSRPAREGGTATGNLDQRACPRLYGRLVSGRVCRCRTGS
jgi:hypothetical protein